MRQIFITLALITSFFFFASPSFAASASCFDIVIPAYFYPSSVWDQAAQGNAQGRVMIINPSNGPGASKSTTYATYIQKMKTAGVTVYGYVHTSYGSRAAATVKSEIATFKDWYGVTDIFFDEAAANAGPVPYYQDLIATVHTNGGKAMLNPGTSPIEEYGKIADSIITFEGSYTTYLTAKFPAWTVGYNKSKFVHLVYAAAGQTELDKVRQLAAERNAGGIYVTNDVLSNPWDTLPPYWNNESAACSSGQPTASPSPATSPTISPTPSASPAGSSNSGGESKISCRADINKDRKVDYKDYQQLLQYFFHKQRRSADINNDGKVNLVDYSILVSETGKRCK